MNVEGEQYSTSGRAFKAPNMGMYVNTDKTKIMIIKSKKDTYANLIYDTSYKYLKIDIHHKLNWNYSIKKMINGGWKVYFGLENNCKSTNLSCEIKIISSIKFLLFFLSCIVLKCGATTFLENIQEILSKCKSIL